MTLRELLASIDLDPETVLDAEVGKWTPGAPVAVNASFHATHGFEATIMARRWPE